jgi:catechol 2,3-dioxygenase-like lactoylglutathione lyase family enzyme
MSESKAKPWPDHPAEHLVPIGPTHPPLPYAQRLAAQTIAQWPRQEPEIRSGLLWRSALLVRNTTRSLALYRDILGLEPLMGEKRYLSDDPTLIRFLGLEPARRYTLTVLGSKADSDIVLNSGFLALFEPDETGGAPIADAEPAARYGLSMLLFIVRDAVGVFDRLKSGGYDVVSERPEGLMPGYPVQIFAYGPDGERIWINGRDAVPTYVSPAYFK